MMIPKALHYSEGMRTTTVGLIGTGLSISLEQYSRIASAMAATLTAFYMLFKCVDWIIEKRHGKRSKTKK